MIKIEYVYASLLLHYAKKPITEESVKKILEAAGIEADEIRIKALIAALKEINIDEAISAATIAAPSLAAPAAPSVAPGAETEEKKELEEEEEAEEEEVAEGLAALFG